MKCVMMTEEEYRDAAEGYVGFCTVCLAFTRDGTEPDAEDYDCPACGGDTTVIGAENALLCGCIEFCAGMEEE